MPIATINLYPLEHRGESQIKLAFPFDVNVKEHVKQLTVVRWSKTHDCFYMPRSRELIGQLMQHCKTADIWVNVSTLRGSAVSEGTSQQSRVAAVNTPVAVDRAEPAGELLKAPLPLPASVRKDEHIELLPEVVARIGAFRQFLEQKRYAYSTIKTYVGLVKQFFLANPRRNWDGFTRTDLEAYNHRAFIVSGKSYATQNQFINAIKLFYQVHEIRGLVPDDIERPRKSTRLPDVLTKAEVAKLLSGIGNLKHRALLSLVYACGLRIGEALTLRPQDLRLAERLLYVRAGKGRKDRRVPLAGKIVDLLAQYQKAYPNQSYLFEGSKGGLYSYTSARQVMKRAVVKAELNPKISLHTLRHSYATHLLQNGTDLRYIQEILGHASPKTTMLYTHVAAQDLKNIKSPFDELEL